MRRLAIILSSLILLIAIAPSARAEQPDSLLVHNGQRLFLSGMNLAWINWSRDLRDFDEAQFTSQMDGLSEAGGNTLRWWLHTNGTNSPQFDQDGRVTGIDPVEIDNFLLALDIAYERGILIMPCLWSFDMMQDNAGSANWPRNRALLENPERTQEYIDNALIPLVEATIGHPGLVAWEIFNEPEGMIAGYGWTPEKIDFQYVQQFVNLTAGAIRRTDPNAKISNGSWNIKVLSDVGSWYNYYTDERLIEAGGDPDGYLDFYMVHYYDEHFPFTESPFHNHVSTWELDKPVVIGEFSSHGLIIRSPNMSTRDMFEFAISNGYAGALSWTMSGHDGNGGLPESRPALLNLQEKYPEVINVIPDPNFTYPPYIKDRINPLFTALKLNDTIIPVVDLKTIFGSYTDGMPLSFTVVDTINEALVVPYIQNDSLMLLIKANQSGSARVYARVTDTLSKSRVTFMTVSVYDPDSDDFLRNRRAFASSIENTGHIEGYAVDGDSTTRWASEYFHDEWIAVEMEQVRSIQRVMLQWEDAYGQDYEIQVSMDGEAWATVYHEPMGNGAWDRILFDPVDTKFIRVKGNRRGTEWGYSLFAFEAYPDRGPNTAPQFTSQFPDTSVVVRERFEIVIPSILVTDPDLGERLFFDVTLADGGSLPSWLSFDWVTQTLNGRATDSNLGESHSLKITVTDMAGESDEQLFTLTVVDEITNSTSNVNKQESVLTLFPNPTGDNLNLRIGVTLINAQINVYNAMGQLVFTRRAESLSRGIHILDLSALNHGVYYLQVTSDGARETQRFIKR